MASARACVVNFVQYCETDGGEAREMGTGNRHSDAWTRKKMPSKTTKNGHFLKLRYYGAAHERRSHTPRNIWSTTVWSAYRATHTHSVECNHNEWTNEYTASWRWLLLKYDTRANIIQLSNLTWTTYRKRSKVMYRTHYVCHCTRGIT